MLTSTNLQSKGQKVKITSYLVRRLLPILDAALLNAMMSWFMLLFFFINCQIIQGIPSGVENHNEFTLYTAIEQSLLNDTTGELFRLRGVFFPSSSKIYQFWKADGLETVQFNACINLTDTLCRDTKDSMSIFAENTTVTACWAYQ